LSALSMVTPMEEITVMRQNRNRAAKYESQHLDVPIVIVTSEIDPWSKTGGLALVAASFAYEFAARGHRTMAVTPMYDDYEGAQYLTSKEFCFDGRNHQVDYFHLYKDFGGFGTDYVFVDNPCFRRPGGIYCDVLGGAEYQDNLFRFSLLSMAALEAPFIDTVSLPSYGQRVTFLANDWQTGLVPLFMRYKYRRNNTYRDARCLYVIHNLGYQGMYSEAKFPPQQVFGFEGDEVLGDIVLGDTLNLTKAALICSDRVVTVSPNYANEITTEEGGLNLQELVRRKVNERRLNGILNGIDDGWDPSIDPVIAKNYGPVDFEEGKLACKCHLQRSLGLEEDPSLPIIGFVGRLTWQKGIDIIGSVIPWLMEDGGNGITGHVQLIMMGNGEQGHADMLKWAELEYPGRVCGYAGFSAEIEHEMMAGCDLLLMPSRYEPCGLPQMHSQLYGTLPIVTETGGLKDSVKSIEQAGLENATGFKFQPLTRDRLKQELFRALELFYRHKEDFVRMQVNAMRGDFYWPRAMDEYEEVIDMTLDWNPQHC